jgi:putative isomerase
MTISRRTFLGGAAALTGAAIRAQAPLIPPPEKNAPSPSPAPALAREQVEASLRPLLRCESPELWRLVVDAYHDCILGKLRPPEPPFRHAWLVPGGAYVGQWLWDTMFVVDLLAVLPGQQEVIRGVFQNYWDFQDRWDAVKPGYAHGMVPNSINPFRTNGKAWEKFPAYSQAPLLAWGMERVFRKNHDHELLRVGLPRLEAFHEWYWRERDVTKVGLIGLGAYSGFTQHARWETYDFEVDLDGLKMTPHPTRKGEGEGNWYGDILIPANTAYLLLSERCLAEMAKEMGDSAMAKRRKARLDAGSASMREHMWDEDKGCFLAVQRDTLKKATVATVGGFMPLAAGVPTNRQAARMAETLCSSAWATPIPVPTVSRDDARFRSNAFWRGDVWPAPNYQVASGLFRYGHKSPCNRIADASIENALRVGISERYDSVTGQPLGVRGLGMSASLITMALDGLSAKWQVRPNKEKS